MTFLHPLSLFDRSKSRATIAWQLLDNDVVEGRVIDIAGEPVSGLSLLASVSSNEQFIYNRSITRKDGTFGLRLSDGTYTVSASCKKRGFCPSCMGLRMADTATRLTDDDVRTIVDAIEVRCTVDPTSVATHRMGGMIIRHDVDDIGTVHCCSRWQ